MLVGKRGAATTAISAARSDCVTVRGRDLAFDLMGKTTFTEFFEAPIGFFLASKGEEAIHHAVDASGEAS
ncbi:MAG TPA: hypothetical protein VKS78_07225 [Roseiarcus sp.]|nr:hypothetical protein [Roseiarcus sp.]